MPTGDDTVVPMGDDTVVLTGDDAIVPSVGSVGVLSIMQDGTPLFQQLFMGFPCVMCLRETLSPPPGGGGET